MHPTLLIGPADWDAERLPQEEFAARIAALWERWPQAAGALVYGDSRDHAALGWLTNFTPKLEPAIALIPRNGAPKLMVGGGPNMLPSAKPLTWVTDLVSLRPTGKTIAQWRQTVGGEIVCIGIDAMPTRLRRELDAAFGGATPDDGLAEVQALMQHKSPRERACIDEAVTILQGAVAAMADAHRRVQSVTDVILAGEHAAVQGKAQDVRTLFSRDGGQTYRPFEGLLDRTIDPLTIYVAVCRFGYWVDGHVTLTGGEITMRPAA
jgi:hypothetical protein